MEIVIKKPTIPGAEKPGCEHPPVYRGKPGPQGPAGTIEIAQVVTIEPSDPARVENIGDSTNAKLILYIPKGDPGNKGEPGAALEITEDIIQAIINALDLTPESVGLGNVDNTSDMDKPVSKAQSDAMAMVMSVAYNHIIDENNPHGVTREQIGLGNVDDTSDMDKPVSIAQAEAMAMVAVAINNHIANEGNPHGVTIDQIGAAPAGYGLGKLTSYEVYSDSEIDTVLIDIINSMGDQTFKRIVLSFKSTTNFTNAGGHYYTDIYKLSTNYAMITIKSYIGGGREMQRIWCAGVLEPWEWVNPPMVLGVEYRTTERHNGAVVYAVRLTVGELLNKGTTSTSLPSTPAEIVELFGNVKSDAYTEEVPFPVITLNGTIGARLSKGGSNTIVAKTFADYGGYVATATVRYTKAKEPNA